MSLKIENMICRKGNGNGQKRGKGATTYSAELSIRLQKSKIHWGISTSPGARVYRIYLQDSSYKAEKKK